jgi:hypothetical protein
MEDMISQETGKYLQKNLLYAFDLLKVQLTGLPSLPELLYRIDPGVMVVAILISFSPPQTRFLRSGWNRRHHGSCGWLFFAPAIG